MINWNYNSEDYTARNFELVPEGDHKVVIHNVVEKVFSSGNQGFEITFNVAGSNSKLWYYLVLDPKDPARTNQRLGMFFDSFAIQDYNLSNFNQWVGRDGAVRVKHDVYNGAMSAKVIFCLSRAQQVKFDVLRMNPFEVKTPAPVANATPQRTFDGFQF